MGLLGWVMMAIALWHFTVFLPDRFWSGIVGAFIGSVVGAVLFGLAIHGFTVPGRDDTDIVTVLEAIPGTILGLAVTWFIGVRQEQKQGLGQEDAFLTARPH
jgi:hypothetical protein